MKIKKMLAAAMAVTIAVSSPGIAQIRAAASETVETAQETESVFGETAAAAEETTDTEPEEEDVGDAAADEAGAAETGAAAETDAANVETTDDRHEDSEDPSGEAASETAEEAGGQDQEMPDDESEDPEVSEDDAVDIPEETADEEAAGILEETDSSVRKPEAGAVAAEEDAQEEPVMIFYIGNDYNGAIDPSNATTYTIEVPDGVEDVHFEIVSGTAADVSDDGVVSPGNEEGTVVVRVTGKGYTRDIMVEVRDYAEYTYSSIIRQVADDVRAKEEELSSIYEEGDALKAFDVLWVIWRYVTKNYSYSWSCSNARGMVFGGAGDCIANSELVMDICREAGIEAYLRYSANYPGCGNNHYNVIAKYEGKYYVLEAGETGSAPRSGYALGEEDGFYYSGSALCQYDGFDEDVVIPTDYATSIRNKYNGVVFARNQAVEVKTVTIPSTITDIDPAAFYSAYSLQGIYVDEDNEYYKDIDGCLYTKDGSTLVKAPCGAEAVTIAPGTKVIGTHALSTMTAAKEIVIPDGVEEICDNAINACDYCLEKVVIPASVTKIGSKMLAYGYGNTVLYVYAGSYAEQYAKDNNLRYEIIKEETECDKNGHTWDEGTVTKAASCEEPGVMTYACTVCGEEKTEEIPVKGHSWSGEYTVDKAPSCTESGVKSIHCSKCGAVREGSEVVVPAKGHSYSGWATVKEASCEEPGSRRKVCAVCEDEVTEEIPAKGHTWSEDYTVDKAPTCTETGIKSIHCTECDAVKEGSEAEIPAAGHKWDEGAVTAEPSCEQPGVKTYTCSECGEVRTEEIPATGHDWGEWQTVREATEDEEGLEVRTCENDPSHTEERAIPKADHVHKLVKTEAKAASCTEDGNIEYWTCSKCGRIYSDSEGGREVSAEDTVVFSLGHSYSDWVTVKEASCEEPGSIKKTCAVCGDETVQEIPAKGHTWNSEYAVDRAPSCLEEGSESIHCSVCGAAKEGSARTIAKLGHRYGEWTIVKAAACEEAGSRKHICTVCKDEVTEEIPAAGHNWGEWKAVREATEDEEGLEVRTCLNDPSHKEERTVPKTDHVHELVKTEANPASCTKDGNIEYWTCSKCGRNYADAEGAEEISEDDTVIKAAGHSWDRGVVTKGPSCEKPGVKTYTCSECGEVRTDEVPATGHNWNNEYTVDRAPSCLKEGSESIHCSVCGIMKDKSARAIGKTDHRYEELITVSAASCEKPGSIEEICVVCGDRIAKEVPAKGHAWSEDYTIDKAPGCTETGMKSTHCTECNAVKEGSETVISAVGHEWDENYTVDKEPSCTEDGTESIHCMECDAVKEGSARTIAKLGHRYGEWVTVTEPKCEEPGSRKKTCAACGDEITEKIPAPGHSWSGWKVVREATEEEEGLETRTCANDPSHTEERAIPKADHVHKLVKTEAKAASCTENGNTQYWTCSGCGRLYADAEGTKEISAENSLVLSLGHSYGSWETAKEASCEEAGSRKQVCSVCGDEIVQEIPAKGHTWNSEYTVDRAPSCLEEGSESIHCSVCGIMKDKSARAIGKTDHRYEELITVSAASCEEPGSIEEICVVCGDRIAKEVPAKGHAWSEDYTIDKVPGCTETGMKSIHCTECNAVKEGTETVIPAVGHEWDEGSVTAGPSCEQPGVKTYTCSECGEVRTEETPAKGHTWNSEYTVDREASYDKEGIKSIHCGICGAVKEGSEVSIPKLAVRLGKTTRGDMFNLANSVKVTWKEVPGAKYYKVYREGVTDPGESLKEPVIVTQRLIGWDQQPGLTNGHAYRYRIVASMTGRGDPSGDSALSYSKLMYRLKTVVIRRVKNTAPGRVTVRYDKTVSGDSYVLQYCEREDMVGAKTKVILGADNTSYTIGGLKKGKTYYISIRVRRKVNGIDYYTTFGVPKKIRIEK